MARNDYRLGKRQLSVVLDVGLVEAVKVAAGGGSVSEFVRSVLAREVGYGAGGVGSRDREVFGASGVVAGPLSVGGGGGGVVGGVVGRGVDWDAVLAAGRANKPRAGRQFDCAEIDPIEEIA